MKTIFLMIQLATFSPSAVPATKVILIPFHSADECLRAAKTTYAAFATGEWGGTVSCVQYLASRRDE